MIKRDILPVLALLCLMINVHLVGQQPAPAASTNVAGLRVLAPQHDPFNLTLTELKAMPHLTITVHNAHNNADEIYSGVRLADLLSKVGTPLGKSLRGKALAHYIVASGSDGYQTVLALGEVDPEFHPGEVIAADAMDGKPLDTHSGPLKLVVTEDKHPARSVRNPVTTGVYTPSFLTSSL